MMEIVKDIKRPVNRHCLASVSFFKESFWAVSLESATSIPATDKEKPSEKTGKTS